MFKKLFTILLAAVMMLSMCTVSLAAKEEEQPVKGENIYKLWGDFENEAYWEGITTGKVSYRNAGGKGLDSIADIGANGSKHSLKVDHTGPDKSFWIQYAAYPGETYDLSMMIKTDTPEMYKIRVSTAYDADRYIGTYMVGKDMEITQADGWVNYSYTFTVPKKHNGKNINNATYLNFDIDEGLTNYVIYIDDLSLVPHNYLPDADYSIINAGMIDPEGGDGVEVIAPAETVDVQFKDIDNHWAEDTIKTLAKFSYVNGVSTESFAPNAKLSRAQFVKMAVDLYDEDEIPYDGRWKDVKEESWFAEPLMRADKLGIIPEAMKTDGKMLPDEPITREEAAAIAAKVAIDRGAKPGKAKAFADASKISEWARESVDNAVSTGMITGHADGSYKPQDNLTRAEASTILMRMLEVSERVNIYVDAKVGRDGNPGTESLPLASIEKARDMAKKYAPNMRNDIYIKIRGEQYLEDTFKLDETHSGQNGYKIVYTSWDEDNQANITMAKKYKGFTLHDRTKNIWKVDIGKGTYSRQAYFNDVPGIRARTVGYMKNGKYVYQSHYECDNRELLDIEYPTELEFVYHIYWFNIYHQVGKISEMDNGKIRVDMHPQYFYTGYNRVNYYDGAKSARRQTPSYMENAYQFLDQQGEFYVDKHEGYLYYIPRKGEDMKTMEAKLPLGEEMIRAEGKDFNTPITHIAFDNLILEGATWLRTEQYGGADFVQNNELNDYAEEVPDLTDRWCIYFEACRYIDITNCNVRHIGCPGGALMFYRGAKHINIIGNEISQVSGVGLCVDYMMVSSPYNRALNDRCEYVAIENNYIHDVAMDYEGGAAITLGHLRHSRANYNEISNVPYSGFHVGWGWEGLNTTGSIMYDLEINYNYIHDMMKSRNNDGGAIYTLGKSSLECDQTPDAPNEGANKNRIIGNYMSNGWNCDYMYHDNSSSSWYVANNVGDDGPMKEQEFNFDRTPWTQEQRFWSHMYHKEISWQTHVNNYANEDYGYEFNYMNMKESYIEPVNLYPDRNWPEEARKIMAEAGIQDEYKDKFNLTGPRIFSSIDRWQSLEVGVPQDSGIKILGDYNTEYPISDFDIQWWIDDPTAVTLDKNGMLTAHKPGLYEAEAFLFLDGVWQSVHFLLECGNEPTRAYLNHEIFNVVQGASVAAQAYVDMAFSATVEVTNSGAAEVEFTSDNPEIATIELRDDGKYWMVTAHKEGSTTIRGKVTYMGKTFNFEVPFNTITRSNQEAVNLPFKEFNFAGNWQRNGSFGRDGGYLVTGSPNFYQTPMSGLVAFDVSITPGHGWPAFTFSGDRANVSYTSSDCYMVGFTKDYIEFQRFNQGNRTMIFGNSNGPISGYAVGNKDNAIYTYGERMSVVLGAIDVEGGTRIVVNVNGKNYIDYTDRTSKRLPSHGYWAIYNPATGGGGMNFFPYSGITK